MEKVTKWDRVHGASSSHVEVLYHPAATVSKLLEWELDRAHARIVALEEENKRLGRFLWKLEKEKRHRRELEAANARLLRELKQQSKSYSMERKARELMEEACSELTREVEADQAEAELLRRRMREEMEEELRMLQMAEVWREERVQMKLSDAKLALDHKYSQLNRLQAEMEELLLSSNRRHNTTGRARSLPRPPPHLLHDDDDNKVVDVDSVFEHFRRKEKEKTGMEQESCSKSNSCASPATDLFLAKADGDPFSDGLAGDRGVVGGTSVSASAELSHNNGGSKNTALIRRLWRSAITESRKKYGAEECTSSASAATAKQKQKQSLKEKLMEARMDDQKEKTLQKHRG
jgi:hypothetical protein